MKKIGLFVCFIYPFLVFFSQDWKVEIAKDNFFTIEEDFPDSKKKHLNIEVFNADKNFTLSRIGSSRFSAQFPDDFKLKKGDSVLLLNEKFNIEFFINRHKVSSISHFNFVPNPKGFFQLSSVTTNINFPIAEKEKIIDQFFWEDQLGENYFVRSQRENQDYKFIYFYHFIAEKENLKLIKKISDKSSSASLYHNIESIQITDLNEDMIAEISCTYFINEGIKTVLTTESKKYYLRADKENKISLGSNLKKEGEFKRFLIQKSKTNN